MSKKRRNYPSHRRTPIAHTVDGHRRDGHSVSGYDRGSGGRSSSSMDSRGGIRAEAFIVTMRYKDKSSEKISVFAPRGAYKRALDEAMEERTHKEKPVEINILDPSLGEVIKYMSKGAGTGLKWVKSGIKRAKPHVIKGVKKAGRGAKALGRGIGKTAKSYKDRKEAEKLINQSYSANPSTRAFARKKLKTKYPELYDNCDFSTRETSRVIRDRRRLEKAEEEKRKKQRKDIKKFFLGSKKSKSTTKKKSKKKKKKKKSTSKKKQKKKSVTITF